MRVIVLGHPLFGDLSVHGPYLLADQLPGRIPDYLILRRMVRGFADCIFPDPDHFLGQVLGGLSDLLLAFDSPPLT
jgi:hypothetical protein